jgi:2-polyprenyl-6-methoxyphenol hydroxylase-like FAD-dependent oxidoreductase
MSDHTRRLDVSCCIAGGGPAGMMLGFLLARAGVRVSVLEKHADFFRDFRGDTIHPSTLEVMHELGMLDRFLARPHQRADELGGTIGNASFVMADFRHLPTRCKFIAFMPQWDFLDFIAGEARGLPSFHLEMAAEVVDLVVDRGRVCGVRARTAQGALDVTADLVVAADGRHSTLRDKAGLAVVDLGAPMDVLWLRLSRRPDDGGQSLGHIDRGAIFVTIDRGDYWQCALVIPKGGFDALRQRGIEAFRAEIGHFAPALADRAGEIASWDDVKLLTVAVDRMPRWHKPGLLFIGDAAHAMSPVGGVGINLAIQDAIATANLLGRKLREGVVGDDDLAAVQRRRQWPTRLTQGMQIVIQNKVIRRVLAGDTAPRLPLLVRLLQRFPMLRRIPARIVGLGFRPEHVRPR